MKINQRNLTSPEINKNMREEIFFIETRKDFEKFEIISVWKSKEKAKQREDWKSEGETF